MGAKERGGSGEALAGDGRGTRASKGQAPGNHFVDSEPQCVDVGARVGLSALDDLRREIGDGAEKVLRLARGEGAVERFGDSEVRDLRDTGFVDDDVLGLDIAVDDALFMRVLEGGGHLQAVTDSLGLGHTPLGFEELAQGIAVDVLHHDEATAFVDAGVEHADDVGVLEPRDNAGLAFEGGDGTGIGLGAEGFAKELDGDPAAEPFILGEPDFGHPAGTEQAFEAVSSVYDIRGVHRGMSLRQASGSRERNIEVLLLTGAAGFAVLGWYALRAAEFALPASTGRILTQFAASGLAAHVAGRVLAPRARPEILAIAAFLAAVGLVFVIRLAPGVAADQANWVSIGAAAFAAGLWAGRRYPRLKQYTYTSGVAGLAVLVATGLFGTTNNGARLWVEVAGQTVQTTELIKVFVIVFMAGYLADAASVLASPTLRIGDRTYSGGAYLVPLAAVLLGAVGALALLRDLGSIAILLLLAVGALYLATGRVRFVAGGIALLAATGIAGYVLFDHVQVRVDTWLDPGADPAGAGYQTMQATYAIQAGGITGAGPGLGQPNAVPAAPTDYIYTAIAEELGLAGAAGVALLYVAFLYAGLRVAAEAGDTYGRLLAACIALLVAIQAAVIIAGNLRVIPTTGITLPFVSYGGSSLVVNFGLAGLLGGISDVSRRGLTAGQA